MHHPCQIAYPDWGASDFDGRLAQDSRSQLIERFADSDTLIIGAHFADPVAGRIRREGATFRPLLRGRQSDGLGHRQPIGTEMPIPPWVSAPYRAISLSRSSRPIRLRACRAASSSRSAGMIQAISNSRPSGSLP